MELFFIRHGEHGGEGSMLTDIGREEVSEVKERIEPNDTSIVFYPPGSRFSQTAEIILGQMDSKFKRHEVRQLSYLRINQTTPYYNGLIQSIRERKCLEYHIHNSDNHIIETGENISSYTTMASLTAGLILKYISILQNYSGKEDLNLMRVFCAREFIWSSFRAKIIELKYGEDAMHEYVQWYSQTQEGKAEARRNVTNISSSFNKTGDISIYLSDIYGEEELSISALEDIVQQGEALKEFVI